MAGSFIFGVLCGIVVAGSTSWYLSKKNQASVKSSIDEINGEINHLKVLLSDKDHENSRLRGEIEVLTKQANMNDSQGELELKNIQVRRLENELKISECSVEKLKGEVCELKARLQSQELENIAIRNGGE